MVVAKQDVLIKGVSARKQCTLRSWLHMHQLLQSHNQLASLNAEDMLDLESENDSDECAELNDDVGTF